MSSDEVLHAGYSAMATLLQAGGDQLSAEDRHLLLKRPEQVTEADKGRIGEIVRSAFFGFFHCAADGHPFADVKRIEDQFRMTLEENYKNAGAAFLRFATTYWTLKLVVGDLTVSTEYRRTGIQQLLLKVETDVASVFFPTPGPIQMPARKREEAQRGLLQESGAPIDIEEFIAGNPILQASPSRSGCLGVVAVMFILLVATTLTFRLFLK